ncbi:MAG: hypothetical protein ACJ0DI_09550 [bacterium]
MSEVILYTAVSLDGFIAPPNEEVLIPSIFADGKTDLKQSSKLEQRIRSIGISMNLQTFKK